ncbi:putative peptidoglycan peptidase [Golden Marseillevirus]|nr:putative peptidoglycan peptidase [Golden Marseillevirus]ALX27609.1 putative peptidoglycan peptidase [Golden Marseillevirus]
MVVRIKDKLFLWEADIGQGKKKGPRMIPFEQKLRRYKGYKTGAIVRIKKEIDCTSFVQSAEKNFDLSMDECMFAYFLGRSNNDKTVFCSELLARTLKDCGLFQGKEVCRGISPSLFLEGFSGLYKKPEYFSW